MTREYARLVTLQRRDDDRGALVFGEFSEHLPFVPRRFFVVSGVPDREAIRGVHAHKTCHQFLVCLQGSLAAVADDGYERSHFDLKAGLEALYMPPLTWGSQNNFSSDAILLVLASDEYAADDYIHDYDEFLALVGTKGNDSE